jgi:hypothetical protein
MAIDTLVTNPLVTPGPARAILSGRFAPAGGSAPTGVTGDYGFAATRTATGKWSCTFAIPTESTLLGAYVTGNDQASSDRLFRITGLGYGSGLATIIVAATTYSTAAAVDPAANAATLIWVQLHVKLSVPADGSGL